MDEGLFDFEPHVQNHIIKDVLLEKTTYLKPCYQFQDSKAYLYETHYIDSINPNKWPLKTLAQLLILLIEREYLLPVTSSFVSSLNQYGQQPYFIFKEDNDNLTDREYDSIEYFDIHDAAKIIKN